MSQNQFIVIDGVCYHADRPSSCRKCYFWKNRKAGCILGKENCYYLMETPRKSRCDGCSYAKGRPCVTLACYKDLAASVRSRRKAGGKGVGQTENRTKNRTVSRMGSKAEGKKGSVKEIEAGSKAGGEKSYA